MMAIKRYLPAILLVLSGQLLAAELINNTNSANTVEDTPIENVAHQRKKSTRQATPPAKNPPVAKPKAAVPKITAPKSKNNTNANANASTNTKNTKNKTATAKNKPSIGASNALSTRQLNIARNVRLGVLECAFGVRVSITPDVRMKGRFTLGSGNKRYTLYPVPTTTGVVRLEDKNAGIVWLQLPTKSMLVSQKEGRRIADECVNYSQYQEKKTTPRSSKSDSITKSTPKSTPKPKPKLQPKS